MKLILYQSVLLAFRLTYISSGENLTVSNTPFRVNQQKTKSSLKTKYAILGNKLANI